MNLSSSFTTLSLFYCHLQGKVKINIFRFPSIQTFDLGEIRILRVLFQSIIRAVVPSSFDCNFKGEIPASLGNLTQITHLTLSGNHFIGSIPPSLGNLTKLIYLDLSYNNFNGEIQWPLLDFSVFDWHVKLTIFNYWGFNRFAAIVNIGLAESHKFKPSQQSTCWSPS